MHSFLTVNYPQIIVPAVQLIYSVDMQEIIVTVISYIHFGSNSTRRL